MSVLGKKPFVNKIIESLSTEQIVKLRKLIDNPTDLRTIALYGVDNLLSENDKGVHFVKCKLEELSLRIVQGFLCYADDDNCALFVFNNGSDIVEEYVIYPKVRKFERVYEYLNAEEFRRVLDDSEEQGGSEAWSESMKDKMVFNSATNTVEIGTNLYVDGKISLSGVDDIKQYTDVSVQALKDAVDENYAEKTYVDNQFNLCVKLTDIDTDFSLTSTNPIQNKVISKQIKDINYTIMTMKEELFETVLSEVDYKVDYATIYPIPETLSDNDGTHRVVYSDTQLKEIEGNSVAFNQMINGLTGVDVVGGTATIDSDNVITYTLNSVGNSIADNSLYKINPTSIQNHTYLTKFSVKCSHITPIRIYVNGFYVIGTHSGNNQWQDFYAIRTAGSGDSNHAIYFECLETNGYVVGDTIQVRYWNKFDLTLFPLDISSVEEFNRIFPLTYYPYNAGEIKNTVIKGVRVRNSKLTTVPLNKISVVDLGTLNWLYSSSGLYFSTNNIKGIVKAKKPGLLCSKYPIIISASSSDTRKRIYVAGDGDIIVFDGDYTDATTFKQAMSGVLLYFECIEPQETISQEVANEFVNKTIQIPQTKLPSAGSVHDTIKIVEGNIVAGQQRYNMVYVSKTDNVDLGTLDYGKTTVGSLTDTYDFYTLGLSGLFAFHSGLKNYFICSKYMPRTMEDIQSNHYEGIAMWTAGQVRIYDSSKQSMTANEFKTAMSGVMLNYEKATPTETTLATDLTFEEVSAIIEQGGSIETVFEIVPPNLKTAFVVNKAIVS